MHFVEYENASLFPSFSLCLFSFTFLLFFLMSVHFAVPEVVVKHKPLAKYESIRAVNVILGNPQ